MINFGKQYGFEFVCHEINHCNRKAGNERSFYTLNNQGDKSYLIKIKSIVRKTEKNDQ